MIHRRVALPLCVFLILVSACSDRSTIEPDADEPAYFKIDPNTAGMITGNVILKGKRPAPKIVDMDQDPQCAELHQQSVFDNPISVGDDGSLANAFVWIRQGLEDKKFEPPTDPIVIDQKGCWFGPRVLGLQVGQTVKVLNSDPVTHNIHPLAEINREWNQSQSPGAEPLIRKFSRPEVMIRVKCNIHNWMHAWIGVVDHPYFAVTGPDGAFQLNNVPPGKYTIEVWHEVLGRKEEQITLARSGRSETIIEFRGE